MELENIKVYLVVMTEPDVFHIKYCGVNESEARNISDKLGGWYEDCDFVLETHINGKPVAQERNKNDGKGWFTAPNRIHL